MQKYAKYVQNHAEICKMMIQAFCEVAACLRRFADLKKNTFLKNMVRTHTKKGPLGPIGPFKRGPIISNFQLILAFYKGPGPYRAL